MEARHETTTTINEEARIYSIDCTCGERTRLRLCGSCKKRPANAGDEVCTPCARSPR